MINITFTCRITCKQVNKDLFFKIPVLRLSYFYKDKSSDIYDSIMILSYPYTTLLKIPFFRSLCALSPQADSSWQNAPALRKNAPELHCGLRRAFSDTACCQEKRSTISIHMRPLWYGHFQNPALSSLRLTVPSA